MTEKEYLYVIVDKDNEIQMMAGSDMTMEGCTTHAVEMEYINQAHEIGKDIDSYAWKEGKLVKCDETKLRRAKFSKEALMIQAAQESLRKGFIFNVDGYDVTLEFSEELEKELFRMFRLFEKKLIEYTYLNAKYNGDDIRIKIDINNLDNLELALYHHTNSHHTKLYEEIIPRIKGCETLEELEKITWEEPNHEKANV